MKRKMTVLAAVLGLLAISGLATAQTTEEDEDTVFNFGYDETFRLLLWNLTPSDGLFDCSLENGPLTTTYGLSGDGLVQVDGLTSEGGEVVSFPARPQDELADGLLAADGPSQFSGADGECGLGGASVEGPNQQVNHGMFMRTFNSMFEGTGRGCVNRFLAQSDLGTGAQQIRVPDVDLDAPVVADGDEGTIDFETVLADCRRGNEDKVNGQGNSASAKAAKADKERGKSASAPGKNK